MEEGLTTLQYAFKKKVHLRTVQRWLASKKKMKELRIKTKRDTSRSPHKIYEY